jgi:hypothetical protein
MQLFTKMCEHPIFSIIFIVVLGSLIVEIVSAARGKK